MSRIEQLIDEIEEFIESCKPQPFSQTKIIVPKDELFELLTELRMRLSVIRKLLPIKIRLSAMQKLRHIRCSTKRQLMPMHLLRSMRL